MVNMESVVITGDAMGYLRLVYVGEVEYDGEMKIVHKGNPSVVLARSDPFLMGSWDEPTPICDVAKFGEEFVVSSENGVIQKYRLKTNIANYKEEEPFEFEALDKIYESKLDQENFKLFTDNQHHIHAISTSGNHITFNSDYSIQKSTKFLQNMKIQKNSQISAIEFCEDRVAIGGRDLNPCVFDLSGSILFQAKNVPNDHLRLPVPIWNTDFEFLDPAKQNLAAVTGFAQIRLYDTRASTQPLSSYDLADKRTYFETTMSHLTRVTQIEEHVLVVSDTKGNLQEFDLRKGVAQAGKRYHGSVASIKDVCFSGEKSLMYSGGLDRVLRVYNMEETRQKGRIGGYCYNKQPITKILCLGEDEERLLGVVKEFLVDAEENMSVSEKGEEESSEGESWESGSEESGLDLEEAENDSAISSDNESLLFDDL